MLVTALQIFILLIIYTGAFIAIRLVVKEKKKEKILKNHKSNTYENL